MAKMLMYVVLTANWLVTGGQLVLLLLAHAISCQTWCPNMVLGPTPCMRIGCKKNYCFSELSCLALSPSSIASIQA